MVAKRLWLVGVSSLLAACQRGDGTGTTLPPCTGGPALSLAVGAYQAIDPTLNSGCTVFPASASPTEYLLVSQAASGIPNDTQSFKLQGSALAPSAIAPRFAAPAASPAELSPADQFHLFLRQAERSRAYPVPPRQPRAAIQASLQGPILPSDSGKNRTFKVCGNLTCGSDSLRTVRATLMKLGQHIALYQDSAAPQPSLSQTDLDTLRAVFDTRLYEIDTTAFGRESDIDANGVVIVLMTNRVNQLVTSAQCTSPTGGFVAGYFFGADIDPFYATQYNNGEIFYSIVPDPNGTLSCAHSVAGVKRLVPVTFIHEFQHMISYNHHVLERRGEAEILWLNESLSHYAEELGGRSFLPADTATYCNYVFGDVYNSAQYFQAPQSYFLVDTSGIGALASRGAYWLFLRYILDQYSGDTSFAQRSLFTRKLDMTSLTGPENVATQTGQSFQLLLERWTLANWVSDLPGFATPAELQYKMWRFRTDYGTLKTRCPSPPLNTGALPATLPLVPGVGAGNGVNLSGILRAGSGTYFRVQQAAGTAGFTVLFSDGLGRALRTAIVPRLNVMRVQ